MSETVPTHMVILEGDEFVDVVRGCKREHVDEYDLDEITPDDHMWRDGLDSIGLHEEIRIH